jgi:hypothetical protein
MGIVALYYCASCVPDKEAGQHCSSIAGVKREILGTPIVLIARFRQTKFVNFMARAYESGMSEPPRKIRIVSPDRITPQVDGSQGRTMSDARCTVGFVRCHLSDP